MSTSQMARENEIEDFKLAFWLKVSLILFTVVLLTSFVHQSCYSTDLRKDSQSTNGFAGLNARIHLQRVTAFGPRTAGSIANELLTPDYFRQVLRDISFKANASGLSAVFEEQVSQYSSFQTHFHITSYNHLRNFILRIHDPRDPKLKGDQRSCFLVNCHYDSALTSPGASDDFVGCAIMLEVARVMAAGHIKMVNDIIFLFNGAEENMLPSSHAFITQHPWSSEPVAFLNLEGAGAGGRLLVFQSGPGESSEVLMRMYAETFKQPFGQVMAEELFQSGLIPSDTDFRIFRDYGLIPGIDMAYVTDGYCYHTPYDTESRITADCLQATGNDILEFLTAVVERHNLSSIKKLQRSVTDGIDKNLLLNLSSDAVSDHLLPKSNIQTSMQSRQVYFDLLGLKMFLMSWGAWKLFNWLLCFSLMVYFAIRRQPIRKSFGSLVFAVLLQIACQLIGFLLAALLGWVIRTYGCRMTWYSARHNIVGVFLLPFLCWNVWFHTYFFQVCHGMACQFSKIRTFCARVGWGRTSGSLIQIEHDFFDAAMFILSFTLAILNLLDSRIVYIPTVWLTMVVVGRLLSCFVIPFEARTSVSRFIVTFLPVLICHSQLCIGLFDFLIPLLGRAGHYAYPDIAISLCTYFLLLPIFLFFAGPLQCTNIDCGKALRVLLLNACISYAILVHASAYGFSYTVSSSIPSDPSASPRYQRVGVIHTDRTLRLVPDNSNPSNVESHVWIIPLDDNGVRYLKPDAYPKSVPSSLLALLYQVVDRNSTKDYKGLSELSDAKPVFCDSLLPYCGLVSIYPFLHRINDFYSIPTAHHNLQPKADLRLISRSVVPGKTKSWNFTFSVVAGPPNTQIIIRFETPVVRLLSWSFNSSTAVPIPMPLPKARSDSSAPTGAHYLISHINAGAVNASGFSWNTPWTFWIVADASLNEPDTYFDIVIASMYMDEHLPSRSSELADVLSRLPPWVVTLHTCASYDHYRFGFQ